MCCIEQPWVAGAVMLLLQMWKQSLRALGLPKLKCYSAALLHTTPGVGAMACGVCFFWT